MINLNIFSQYRSALMGFSTVLILICHSIEYIGVNKGLMYHLLIQGNRGVDIFLFLSGIGIYYSLNRIPPPISQKLPYWYAKRLFRVLIPYVIIAIPVYITMGIWNYETLYGYISDFITNILMISYFTNHIGLWFIPCILLLYIVAPLGMYIKKSAKKILFALGITIVFELLSYYDFENNVTRNFSILLVKSIPFIWGLVVAPFVASQCKIKTHYIIIVPLLIAIPLRSLHLYYEWTFMFVMMLLVIFLSKKSNMANKILSVLGRISLESYLFNWALIELYVKITPFNASLSVHYLIACIAGLFFSYLFNKYISSKLRI